MEKSVAKKVIGKMSSSVEYANEAVDKIRSKKWAAPVGVAMGTTASTCENLNWVPGLSLVGGALKIGSSLLNPAPSLADLKKQVK